MMEDEGCRQRWQRRKEARPGEILAAALAVFAEHGFAATRLDRVAERAGVTKGTLYLYFPSKEELFKSVVRHAIVNQIAAAEAMTAASPEPASILLERYLTAMSDLLWSTPAGAIPKLVIAEAGNFPELARFYLEEVMTRGQRLIASILRRGVESGEFRSCVDVDQAVTCVIGPLLIALLWRHSFEPVSERRLDSAQLLRTHLDLLLHGLHAGDERAFP